MKLQDVRKADVVLIDGDPSAEPAALRHAITVVSDGYVWDGNELRRAADRSKAPATKSC